MQQLISKREIFSGTVGIVYVVEVFEIVAKSGAKVMVKWFTIIN